MDKEDIFLLLNRVSTPTGYTLYGDITLDDKSCEEIIDYIEEKEEKSINYKQALIDIRELLTTPTSQNIVKIPECLKIIDKVLGDDENDRNK